MFWFLRDLQAPRVENTHTKHKTIPDNSVYARESRRGFVTVVSVCDSVCGYGGVVSLSVWRQGFVTVVSVCDYVCWYGGW